MQCWTQSTISVGGLLPDFIISHLHSGQALTGDAAVFYLSTQQKRFYNTSKGLINPDVPKSFSKEKDRYLDHKIPVQSNSS